MKLQFAVVMSFASFLWNDALAADVYIRDGRGFTGEAHKLWPHNSCVEVPKDFKFSALYVHTHNDIVRLWQGSGCTGENRAYGTRGVMGYDYIGDVMNRNVLSVSACHKTMKSSCDFQLGLLSVTTVVTLAAAPAIFAQFYKGDCRFCLGYFAQCEHRTRNYKRAITDTKNVVPAVRDLKAEKAMLPVYLAELAERGHIDQLGLEKIFNSFFQTEQLADCTLGEIKNTYINSMIEKLDTNKDGKIDVAEFADLGEAMGAE